MQSEAHAMIRRLALFAISCGTFGCLAESAVTPEPIGAEPARDETPAQPMEPAEPAMSPEKPADDPECSNSEPAVEPIFSEGCAFAGCHTGAGAAAGLRLDAGYVFESLVGAPSEQSPLARVEPGDPSRSYVVEKLGPSPSVGARMPLGRPAFDDATIAMISDWIARGAPVDEPSECEQPNAPEVEPASIEIEAIAPLQVGQTVQLTAIVRDATGSAIEAEVRWVNQEERFSYVDAGARLIAIAEGQGRIRAEVGDTYDEIAIEITAAELPAPSFEEEVVPLLESRCALSGCHVDDDEAGDIAFDTGAEDVYYDLVGREAHDEDIDLVRRYILEDSYLWLKVTRSDPPSGERMPANGSLLSVEEIDVLLRWILSGAYCEC
jgi:hypothetical protein